MQEGRYISCQTLALPQCLVMFAPVMVLQFRGRPAIGQSTSASVMGYCGTELDARCRTLCKERGCQPAMPAHRTGVLHSSGDWRALSRGALSSRRPLRTSCTSSLGLLRKVSRSAPQLSTLLQQPHSIPAAPVHGWHINESMMKSITKIHLMISRTDRCNVFPGC